MTLAKRTKASAWSLPLAAVLFALVGCASATRVGPNSPAAAWEPFLGATSQGEAHAPTAWRLTRALAHDLPEVRARAVEALQAHAVPGPLPWVVRAMGDSDSRVATRARDAVDRWDDAVLPALYAALRLPGVREPARASLAGRTHVPDVVPGGIEGRLVWKAPLDRMPSSASLGDHNGYLTEGTLLVSVHDTESSPSWIVTGFDAETGETLWSRRLWVDGATQGVVLGTVDDALVGVDARTGRTIWSLPVDPDDGGPFDTLVGDGRWIVQLGLPDRLEALDVHTGASLWTRAVPRYETRMHLRGDLAFVATGAKDAREVVALVPRTGRPPALSPTVCPSPYELTALGLGVPGTISALADIASTAPWPIELQKPGPARLAVRSLHPSYPDAGARWSFESSARRIQNVHVAGGIVVVEARGRAGLRAFDLHTGAEIGTLSTGAQLLAVTPQGTVFLATSPGVRRIDLPFVAYSAGTPFARELLASDVAVLRHAGVVAMDTVLLGGEGAPWSLDEAVPTLVGLLGDDAAHVGARAVPVLHRLAANAAPGAVARWRPLAESVHPPARAAAYMASTRQGEAAREVLVRGLLDGDGTARAAAMEGLEIVLDELSPEERALAPAARQALASELAEVRLLAARTLVSVLGKAAVADVVPMLPEDRTNRASLLRLLSAADEDWIRSPALPAAVRDLLVEGRKLHADYDRLSTELRRLAAAAPDCVTALHVAEAAVLSAQSALHRSGVAHPFTVGDERVQLAAEAVGAQRGLCPRALPRAAIQAARVRIRLWTKVYGAVDSLPEERWQPVVEAILPRMPDDVLRVLAP